MRNAAVALLLEDEPLISMEIEMVLAGAGFDVSTAMTCKEALAWLESRNPDIVIVDIQLRDGPCHQVVDRIIAAGIPFLVHSGDHPGMHDGTPFSRAVWVSKPSSGNELAEVARALLQT